MLKLEQPSMALNSHEITWSKIRMQITRESIPACQTRQETIQDVINQARLQPGGKLKNLVINCHGLPASFGIGQGFEACDTGLFHAWADKVERIWFVACLVARISTRDHPGWGTGDGNAFCSQIARNANCFVVAPTEEQRNRGGYPIGVMPAYEGLLMTYEPNGRSHGNRYASDWLDNRE